MPNRLQNCGTCEITLNLGAKVQSVVKGAVSTQLVTSVGCALLELSPGTSHLVVHLKMVFCRKIYWLQTSQVIGVAYVTPEFYIRI